MLVMNIFVFRGVEINYTSFEMAYIAAVASC